MHSINLLLSKYRLLILYGLIGSLSASLDFVIFTLLTSKLLLNYQIANVISVHCGIICSFILNRQFNFKIKDRTIKRFIIFYFIGLFGLGLSAFLLYLFIDFSGFNKTFSKLGTILIVAFIQFLLNKTITFSKK